MLSVDDELNPAWRDETGSFRPRIRLGFNVLNPVSGKPVNTVQVYHQQLETLNQNLSNIFKAGTTADVSLIEHPFAVARGAYALMQGGSYIAFEPGESFNLSKMAFTEQRVPVFYPTDRKITFPESEEDLTREIGDLIPEGFGFIKVDVGFNKWAWMLAYRPNFGSEQGVPLQQRERDFQPPKPPRERKQIVNPPRTPSQLMKGDQEQRSER